MAEGEGRQRHRQPGVAAPGRIPGEHRLDSQFLEEACEDACHRRHTPIDRFDRADQSPRPGSLHPCNSENISRLSRTQRIRSRTPASTPTCGLQRSCSCALRMSQTNTG